MPQSSAVPRLLPPVQRAGHPDAQPLRPGEPVLPAGSRAHPPGAEPCGHPAQQPGQFFDRAGGGGQRQPAVRRPQLAAAGGAVLLGGLPAPPTATAAPPTTPWELRWVHFNGRSAPAFYRRFGSGRTGLHPRRRRRRGPAAGRGAGPGPPLGRPPPSWKPPPEVAGAAGLGAGRPGPGRRPGRPRRPAGTGAHLPAGTLHRAADAGRTGPPGSM